MLSTIAWTNRGTSSNDSDGFNALFGANADQARLITDRAILDWEEVIVNFNYSGGGNTLNLTVETADLDVIASGGPTTQLNGKPASGRIRIDSTGTTHYLDPTVGDDAEFTTLTNAFTGYAPGIVGVDLYATMVHELGHVLGFSRQPGLLLQNFMTDTGIDDPNDTDPGNLIAFNVGGGPIEATFTDSDTGHLWEGPGTTATNNAGLPWHVDVLMNPGRAIASNERNLISDLEATILRDAYGYTITLPSTLNNMLVNPNFTTDVLTVNGQTNAGANDLIIIQGTAIPGQLHVTVSTVGGGPTYTEIVPLSQTNSIIVNGKDGNDIIRVEYNGGKATTLNGGLGNDFFDFAFGTNNLNNITGATIVNGGDGDDSIFTYDNNNSGFDTFAVTSTSLARFGFGGFTYDAAVEFVTLTTGTGYNPVNVTSTRFGSKLFLKSAGGIDTVNIGFTVDGARNIQGDIEVQNDPSYTIVNVDDTNDVFTRNIAVDLSGQFGWVTGLAFATIYWDNADIQEIHLTTGGGDDVINVLRSSEHLVFHNSNGRDHVNVGNNVNGMQSITGTVEIDPNPFAVFTEVVLNNAADSVGRNVNWSASGGDFVISGLPFADFRYDYASVIYLSVLGGTGNDNFTMTAFNDDIAYTEVNGGGGFDTLTIDDRTNPVALDTAYISEDLFYRLLGVAVGLRVGYKGIERPTWFAHANTHAIEVDGTPSSIPGGEYLAVIPGSGNDTITIYPHNQQGNLTINGGLSIAGGIGNDSVVIDDTFSSLPINYTFAGSGFMTIAGLGAGIVEVSGTGSVENVTVSTGSGNDVFNINSHAAGRLLFNGGGEDGYAEFRQL
ncbi:MAG: hypothetical protein R3C10_25275 [Pirellulales bacterium]